MLCAWACPPPLAISCVQRSTSKRVHLHCRHVCSAAPQAPVTVAQPPVQEWQDILTQQVEGEYEGVSATFLPDGTPEELPPHLVPEAYREWGVQVHDWQTQCSAGAAADEHRYTSKRLMPTVGVREEVHVVQCLKCEADAVAFVDEVQNGLHARDGQAPPVLPDGSYVFAPRRLAVPGADGADAPTLNPGETGMRFEACLQLHGDREGTGGAPQDAFSQARATRVRVVLLGGPGDERAWDLRRVEVHRERYVGEYNGGKDLCGCGGGMSPFATQAAVSREELGGAWQLDGPCICFGPHEHGPQPSTPSWLPALDASAPGALRLPVGVWVRVAPAGEQGEAQGGLLLQAGTLLASGLRRSAAARYSQEGCLQEVVFIQESLCKNAQ